MMIYHRFLALVLLLIALTACLDVASYSARAETAEDILHTPRRLLKQERRQIDAGRRIKKVVRRIDWLLEDLKSNGLTSEGGVDKYTSAKKQLASVGNTHVPKTVGLLRNARADLKKAYPHLEGADREIEVIVRKLDAATGGASTVLLSEAALRELRHIIKTQEFLKRQTETLVTSESREPADFQRVGKAQQALALPTNRLIRLLANAQAQVDERTGKRFAAARELLEGIPQSMISAAIQIRIRSSARVIGAVHKQGYLLVRLRNAERILTAVDVELAEVLKDLWQLLEELKQLKKEIEESDDKQLRAAQHQWMFRQGDIHYGVRVWWGIKKTGGGPMGVHLRDANGALERARGHLMYVTSSDNKAKTIDEQAKAIAALERALAAGEKESAAVKLAAMDLREAQGSGEEVGEEVETGFSFPPIGIEPDEEEKAVEGEGEEQTAGGKKQRDKGLGDAEKPPVDGEEVDESTGSEGKPGDPGPSNFGEKGKGPGGGEVEVAEAPGLSNPNARAKTVNMMNFENEDEKGGGGLEEYIFGEMRPPMVDATNAARGKRPAGRQARDAASRRRRSAAIKQYVGQLPPEFRQQVADYYEALAK